MATVLSVYGVRGARTLTTHVCVAVDHLGDAGLGLKETADHLNAKHGTIAMLDEDAGAAKSLIIHADLVARHEEQSMTTWDADATQLFANLNGGVTDLRATVKAGNTALDGLVPIEVGLTQEVKDMDVATTDVATLVSDPHIKGTVSHLDGMVANGEDMSKDAKDYVHGILHPKWATRLANLVERVGVDVGKCLF